MFSTRLKNNIDSIVKFSKNFDYILLFFITHSFIFGMIKKIFFRFKGHGVLTLKDPSKVGQVEELMGVIKHSGPAHTKYATLEARLRTFRDWPPALRQQPSELAESGFYYIGELMSND